MNNTVKFLYLFERSYFPSFKFIWLVLKDRTTQEKRNEYNLLLIHISHESNMASEILTNLKNMHFLVSIQRFIKENTGYLPSRDMQTMWYEYTKNVNLSFVLNVTHTLHQIRIKRVNPSGKYLYLKRLKRCWK